MPKLPLFQCEPLAGEAIASFRHLFENPEEGGNMDLITDLLDLHRAPNSPITEELAYFVLESGLLRSSSSSVQNFMCNTAGRLARPGKQAQMQRQINHRILACAAAAGFLPVRAAEARVA